MYQTCGIVYDECTNQALLKFAAVLDMPTPRITRHGKLTRVVGMTAQPGDTEVKHHSSRLATDVR